MAAVTIRNLSEEAHRAQKVRAARHNRSAEAEMRAILEAAVRPEGRLRLGTALSEIGRKYGITNADIEALEQVRDTRPADTPGYRAGLFVWQNAVIPSYLEEVSGSFTLFGEPGRRTFQGRWLYLLPVFLWSPNPAGLFADGDPTLRCTE